MGTREGHPKSRAMVTAVGGESRTNHTPERDMDSGPGARLDLYCGRGHRGHVQVAGEAAPTAEGLRAHAPHDRPTPPDSESETEKEAPDG